MLWIPGPNEVLLIVGVWIILTFGSGLLGIVFLVRRWRAKRAKVVRDARGTRTGEGGS